MEEYKVRWNPLSICWDVLAVCLWLVAIRRATSIQLRRGVVRVKKRLPATNVTGLGAVSGQGGGGAPERTSTLLMVAQSGGAGS